MPPSPAAPPAAPVIPPKPDSATPAAPAAAPASPPAKPAGTPPIAPTERDPADWMGDISADLDALSEAGDAAAEGRKPGEKPASKAPAKPVEPPAKPAAEPQKPAEGAAAEPPEPTKLNDLRSAYATLKKRVKDELDPKIQSLEAKIKEFESVNPPEVKALQSRLETLENRNDELEREIAHTNYVKSKEFAEKYQTPYQEAWRDAMADLRELRVTYEDGTTREATQQDLVELANLPLGEARKKAVELFGESANDVMIHRRKLIDLANAQAKALEDSQKTALERSRASEAERKSNNEKFSRLWSETNAEIVKRYPKMFAPVEGDTEGNALLEKGTAMVDRRYTPTPETAPKTAEEVVRLDAMIRNKAANHDRVVLWLNKARAKIKELETTIAEYEKSAPNGGLGTGAPGGTPGRGYMDDIEAEIDALDKKGV